MKKVARIPHLTFRWRLTLAFGSIVFGAGAIMVASLWLFMRFVPTYLVAGLPSPEGSGIDVVVPDLTGAPVFPPGGDPASPPGWSDDAGAVAFSVTDIADLLETMLWAGVVILLVIAAMAGFAGWVVAGKLLAPLARISAAAKRAGDGTLDHRIQLGGPRDEVRDLADTFDSTLDRLEQAFTAHERFALNAAHELRTPLTATKTLLDIAHAHPDAVDYAATLAQVQQNNDRSIGTVQALLVLTSTEASRLSLERLDLLTVSRSAVERLGPTVPMHVTVSGTTALVNADPALLDLLLNNVLQNAVRHNDTRRSVVVTVGTGEASSWVRVDNTGPVIRTDEVAKLTEPLYRSQRSARDGYGLGLTIVRSVVTAHSAELSIIARPEGGLSVRTCFAAAT